MHQVVRPQLLEAGGQLPHKVLRRLLRRAAVPADVLPKVAAGAVLQDEVDLAGILGSGMGVK